MHALRFAAVALWAMVWFFAGGHGPARAQDAPGWSLVTIGVLAYRGPDEFQAQWAPLRAYLDSAVPGWQFQFIPVTLVSARTQLENGTLDFLITNPGHYVTLEPDFPMSVLATRVRPAEGGERVDQFGSVAFTAASSDVQTLGEVADRSVLAVDPGAFGGFQVAWREFAKNGVDVFADTGALSFIGFPQDQIVTRVLAGEADVGIVRSGLLEAMAREGRISLDDVRVLNANADFTYPERVSTQLYPEWPFLALARTSTPLRDGVARALLATGDTTQDVAPGLAETWQAPVSYHTVRGLAADFAATTSAEPALSRGTVVGWGSAAVLLAGAFALVAVGGRRRARASDPDGAAQPAPCPDPSQPALTRREAEILDLITTGQSTKQIALRLGISPKTVEFHRSNLLKKFEVHSSIQLVHRVAGAET